MYAAFGKLPVGERLERIRQSPNYRDGRFHNLSYTPMMVEDGSYIRVLRQYLRASGRTPAKPLAPEQTDLKSVNDDVPMLIWLGHSSYMLKFNGKTILVDPVLSGHASPVSFMVKAFKGADVYTPADLPEIDVLVITHDHYDHLDQASVSALRTKVKQVVCSLGVGAHLAYWGYDPGRIHELYWHEYIEAFPGMHFTALPARHFSGRGLSRNKTLWGGFLLDWDGVRIILGGDSGYDTHFAEIGNQYGAVDVAILECGQYNPAWKYIHMMPEETVRAAIDLQARICIPVHWGKFNLSLHSWTEPAERVLRAAAEKNVRLSMPAIGKPERLLEMHDVEPWWRDFD